MGEARRKFDKDFREGAARPRAGDRRSLPAREKALLLTAGEAEGTDVRAAETEAKITRNRYEEVSTVSGESRRNI